MIEITPANNPFKFKTNKVPDLQIIEYFIDRALIIFNDRLELGDTRISSASWNHLYRDLCTYKRLAATLRKKSVKETFKQSFSLFGNTSFPDIPSTFWKSTSLSRWTPTKLGYTVMDMSDFVYSLRYSGFTGNYKPIQKSFNFKPIEEFKYWTDISTATEDATNFAFDRIISDFKNNAGNFAELCKTICDVHTEGLLQLRNIYTMYPPAVSYVISKNTTTILWEKDNLYSSKAMKELTRILYREDVAFGNVSRKEITANILDLLADPSLNKRNLRKSIAAIVAYRTIKPKSKRPSLDIFEKTLADLLEYVEK